MGLTPDDIAHRAFTPSVDGYHQGEVRSFLGRVAAQLRSVLSALPESRAELVEPTTTLHDHEPELARLTDQLHAAVAELTAAAATMHDAQAQTSANLELVRAQVAEQRDATDKLVERHSEVSEARDGLVALSAGAVAAPTLFGSDLANQPLFSDNANDLLDGVLDDVLGNLTDEGEPT